MDNKTNPTHSLESAIRPRPAGQGQLIKNWILTGAIAGILGDLAYASAISPLPLPPPARLILGFAFGPLITVLWKS